MECLTSKIFEPITINKMVLKNRLVVSAMVSLYANADGTASEKFIAYHERKAKGGWGLIITEDYIVAPQVGAFKVLPALYADEQIESHRKLTDRIHAAGGKIAAQIYHAGRETSSAITGKKPVAPSAIKDPSTTEIPHELTVDEIGQIQDQFAQCALRVKKAGFDAVEIHGAHGYLIGEFCSSFSNKRSDMYGGTILNRARFAVEIVKKVRAAVGEDFPIIYRMSTVEYVQAGLNIEESKVIARLLENAGVDAIHCSQGVYGSSPVIIPPSAVDVANYIDNAAEIKKVVSIPVIGVGRINDPLLAESILISGKADMVTMARASLADPDMPNKALKGQYDEIIHCIGCLQGCSGEQKKGRPIRCLVNPLTGREDELKIEEAKDKKNIYIAGGGLAGCEAAIVLASRGHVVTLFEKGSQLGGQWRAASVPIGKGDFSSFIVWQAVQLKKLGVTIKLHTELSKNDILKDKPDIVIIATGNKPFVPPIKGVTNDNVVFAEDVLLGKVAVGKNVVIIGGGLVGAETADHLATHGSKVTIVEMLPEIVKDGEANPKLLLKKRLAANNVDIYVSCSVSEITNDSVIITKQGEKKLLADVDTVILATGAKSYAPLAEELQGFHGKVEVLGDAKEARNGYIAIQEAFEKCIDL